MVHGAASLPVALVSILLPTVFMATQTIDSAEDYVRALQGVIGNHSCTAKYKVAPDLYGTLTSFDTTKYKQAQYLDGRGTNFSSGGTAVAWFSDRLSLESFLNSEDSGCCGPNIASVGTCLCRIAQSVGVSTVWIDWPGFPMLDFEYLVTKASFNNRTSYGRVTHGRPLNLIQPTWQNLLAIYNQTFSSVFGNGSGDWEVPSCGPTAAVIDTLSNSIGQTGWDSLLARYPLQFAQLGCTKLGCENLSPAKLQSTFPPQALCEQAAVVRAYLAAFLDANPMFDGTGVSGAAQQPEFIVVPNKHIGANSTSAFYFRIMDGRPLLCAKNSTAGL